MRARPTPHLIGVLERSRWVMAETAPPTPRPSGSPLGTALLVDDEEAVRGVVKAQLEGLGFSVDAVDSGAAAIALLELHAFDILVTDLQMPGVSGIELVMTARSVHPTLAIVLMSGFFPQRRIRRRPPVLAEAVYPPKSSRAPCERPWRAELRGALVSISETRPLLPTTLQALGPDDLASSFAVWYAIRRAPPEFSFWRVLADERMVEYPVRRSDLPSRSAANRFFSLLLLRVGRAHRSNGETVRFA